MTRFYELKFILFALLGFSLVVGTFHAYTKVGAETVSSTLDFAIVAKPEFLYFEHLEKKEVKITLQNVGEKTWQSDQVKLVAIYPQGQLDRVSVWKAEGWVSGSRIAPVIESPTVLPGSKLSFVFNLQAPQFDGMYKERFAIYQGNEPLKGEWLEIDMKVGHAVTVTNYEPKEIRIYKKSQRAELIEDGNIVASFIISSGAPRYVTPSGTYRIFNHIENAYSSKYKLYMPNWMALSHETRGLQGYGMHSLPYWKVNPKNYVEGKIYPGGRLYTNGRLYEGLSHLGTPVSHGCIRFGIRESGIVSDWAPDKTKVVVI